MMNERELLIQLCSFISKKQIVVSDEPSIRSMIATYKNPPFTLAYRAALRLTMQDTHTLNELMKQAYNYLEATEPVKETT